MSSALTKPGVKLTAVTTSDETVYTPPLRALWVGGSGDVAVVAADDDAAVTLVGVSGLLPISVKQVMSTNTDATSIVGIY